MSAVCSVDGCGRDTRANGMCDTHDRQVKRTGTTSPIRPRREPRRAETTTSEQERLI